LQKANLAQEQSTGTTSNGTATVGTNLSSTTTSVTTANSNNVSGTDVAQNAAALASAIPLAQLLAKPGALNALTSLTALGGLTDLLGGIGTNLGPPVQTTGVHRAKAFNTRPRPVANNTNANNNDINKLKSERSKFNPY
jgi:poly(rC)-binding protein 2/3/4